MVTSVRHTAVVLAALGVALVFSALSPALIVFVFGLLPNEYLNGHAADIMRLSTICTSLLIATLTGLVIGRFVPDRPVSHAAIAAILLNVPMLIVNHSRAVSEAALALVFDLAVTIIVAVCVFEFRSVPDGGGSRAALEGSPAR